MISMKVRYSASVTPLKARSVLATLKCRIDPAQAYKREPSAWSWQSYSCAGM